MCLHQVEDITKHPMPPVTKKSAYRKCFIWLLSSQQPGVLFEKEGKLHHHKSEVPLQTPHSVSQACGRGSSFAGIVKSFGLGYRIFGRDEFVSTHLSQGCPSWQMLHSALRSPLWIDTVCATPGGACAAWSCSSSPHRQPSNFPRVSYSFLDSTLSQNSYIQNLSLLQYITCSSLSPLLYPLLLIDPGWSSKTFKIKGCLWFFFSRNIFLLCYRSL